MDAPVSPSSPPERAFDWGNLELRPWRELAILSTIVMEICWIMPWYRTLTIATGQVSPLRAFLVIFLVVLSAHLAIRFGYFLRLKTVYRQGLIFILILFSVFLCIKALLYQGESLSWLEMINQLLRNFRDDRFFFPDEFIVFVMVVIAWWRGISLAQDYMGPSTVMGQFVLGMVMYVLYILLVILGTDEVSPLQPFYLFLFATLIGMTAARISVVSTLRGGGQAGFDRRWLLGTISIALLLVLASFLAAGFGSGLGEYIGPILMIMFALLAVILWLVIAPILYLLVMLIMRIDFFRDLTDTLEKVVKQVFDLGEALGQWLSELVKKSGILERLAQLGPALRLACLGGILILVVAAVLLWVAFKLWQDRARRQISEDRFSLDTDGLLQAIQDALRKRFAQWRIGLWNLLDARRRERLLAAARIRQIYAALMDLCEKIGTPRPPAMTPLEFEPKINELFKGMSDEVDLITQGYLRVRYGMLPETRQEVDEIEAAWQALQNQGEAIQKVRGSGSTNALPKPRS